MTGSAQVVVTGVGSVSAAGMGKGALASALRDGLVPTTLLESSGRRIVRGRTEFRVAAVAAAGLDAWVSAREARRSSRLSSWTVAAARMALVEAGRAPDERLGADFGVCHASCFSSTETTEDLLRALEDDGPDAMSPFSFMESVVNAPAAHVAMSTGASGPNLALSHREGSPLEALLRATALIRAGRVHNMIVTCGDEFCPALLAVLDRFGALCGPDEAPRPFDARRSGVLAAEGACALILENRDSALRRGATILATVGPSRRGFDPSASDTSWGSPESTLAGALQELLASCPDPVGSVVSGASGTGAGDRGEARLLRAAFGGGIPPVFAPKGVTGEFGGHQLAAAMLLIEGCPLQAPADFCMDPQLQLIPASGPPPAAGASVLVSALSSGGGAAWLVLTRP